MLEPLGLVWMMCGGECTAGGLRQILRERQGDAFDDDAFGFKVCDAVVGAVAHVDRLFEKGDERARGLGEPAVGGLIPVDGEVVGGVTFRADDRRIQPALEGAGGEFADGVGAGTDGCYAEIHRWGQGSTGVCGLGLWSGGFAWVRLLGWTFGGSLSRLLGQGERPGDG
jgi:hypothetical protein